MFKPSWRERVAAAQKSGFTEADRKDAVSFVSCPVGEQRYLFPDAVEYQQHGGLIYPQDLMLDCLGHRFYEAVIQDDPTSAHALLDAIEARVLQLQLDWQF